MKFFGGVLSASCLWVLLAGETVFCQISTLKSEPALNPLPAAARVATEPDGGAKPRHFYENLYEGAKASFQFLDVAGLAACAFLDYQKPAQGLKLAPFEVDEEISESLARIDGRRSLGALSPAYYPGVTATWRFASMMMIDAFGIYDYSAAAYARMFRFHQALYYTKVVTHLAKRNVQRHRPDGSDTYSFFSGHTSAAFATSTFLYLETRDFIDALAERRGGRLPLLSSAGWKRVSFGVLYGWAGYVGFSRIHDKKHYLSDVLAGAATGTLVSYLVYPHQLKNDKIQMGVQPLRGGVALGMGIKF
jgi:membrane-associated phospholipid phosphatase